MSSYDSYGDGGGGPQLALPRVTPVVRRLLIAILVAFILQYFISWRPEGQRWILFGLGLAPETWRAFFPFVPIWQLGSYGFLHGGLGHMLQNMLVLYFFGTMLETIIGSQRFLFVYVASLLSGAFLYLLVEFVAGGGTPAIGASGAVMGILIATAVLRPDTMVLVIFIPVKLKWLALALVSLDVFGLLEQAKGATVFTAHWVHVGGAVFGGIAARYGLIWKDPIQGFEERRSVRAEQKRLGDEAKMDELLSKIHDEGINSLSRAERDFLKRMSKRRSG